MDTKTRWIASQLLSLTINGLSLFGALLSRRQKPIVFCCQHTSVITPADHRYIPLKKLLRLFAEAAFDGVDEVQTEPLSSSRGNLASFPDRVLFVQLLLASVNPYHHYSSVW